MTNESEIRRIAVVLETSGDAVVHKLSYDAHISDLIIAAGVILERAMELYVQDGGKESESTGYRALAKQLCVEGHGLMIRSLGPCETLRGNQFRDATLKRQ